MNVTVDMTTPSVRHLTHNLPVRYVQRMKKAPGDKLGEVSLGFTTCRPVTDDNPSTAFIETTNRRCFTLTSPIISQTGPSFTTCIWQWGDAACLLGSVDLNDGGKQYPYAESDLKIKKYESSLDKQVPRNVLVVPYSNCVLSCCLSVQILHV